MAGERRQRARAQQRLLAHLLRHRRVALRLAAGPALARALGVLPDPGGIPFQSGQPRSRRFVPAVLADHSRRFPSDLLEPDVSAFDLAAFDVPNSSMIEEPPFEEPTDIHVESDSPDGAPDVTVVVPPVPPQDTEALRTEHPPTAASYAAGITDVGETVRLRPTSSIREVSDVHMPSPVSRPAVQDAAPVRVRPVSPAATTPRAELLVPSAQSVPGTPVPGRTLEYATEFTPEAATITAEAESLLDATDAPATDTVPDEIGDVSPALLPDEPTVAATEAAPVSPAELFAPTGQDNSAQSWHARLERVARAERQQAVERRQREEPRTLAAVPARVTDALRPGIGIPPTQRIQDHRPASLPIQDHRSASLPIQIAPSARRFLQPLVGIDPQTMRVRQDATASEIVDRAGADALAIGEDVLLGADINLTTPAGLGLLAHELTHVARGRTPAFVPPILRPDSTTTVPDAPADEEQTALRVEAHVTRVAQQSEQRRTDPLDRRPLVGGSNEVALRPVGPHQQPPGEPIEIDDEQPRHDYWGELPAPWEPMPGWMGDTSPFAAPDADVYASLSESSAASAPPRAFRQPRAAVASSAVTASATSSVASRMVYRADPARSTPDSDPAGSTASATAPPAANNRAAVAPDLDDLAKQVYAVLRRRLAAEARRAG